MGMCEAIVHAVSKTPIGKTGVFMRACMRACRWVCLQCTYVCVSLDFG